jgi:hypothetical protein
LRDTYTSALVEVGGISPFAIDVLTKSRHVANERGRMMVIGCERWVA